MRMAAMVFCLTALAGCGAFFPYAEVDVITTTATGKTLPDHLVSFYTGKDCSTVRYEGGRTYCREDEPNPNPAENLYCYNELASVTCYDRPDPYGRGYSEAGQGNGVDAASATELR